MEEIKIACRKCKEEKSESEMKRDPRGKFGFQKICRNCEMTDTKNIANHKKKQKNGKKKRDRDTRSTTKSIKRR